MSGEKSAADGGNVYHIRKVVVWLACLLAVVCLALAIALPLSLTEENVIHQHSYTVDIQPHDPFSSNIWDKWDTSAEARRAFASLTNAQMYGQLQQFDWERNQDGGEDPENFADEIRRGNVGSLLNLQERKETDEIQKMALEYWSVPIIMANDTIHGQATIFPVNIGMAASWSPELIEKSTKVAAIETRNSNIRWTFGPNLDIGRDPRWGRVSEGSGEDPYLTGVLGAAYVRGFQDNGVAACVKHVTGYGLARAGRDYQPADMDLAEMMNVFLKGMKPAIMESWSFMPSYSGIDGVPAHSSRFMINDVIRGHWGWDGVVMADYVGVNDLQNLWQAEDEKHAVRLGLYGGVDMSMNDGVYLRHTEAVAAQTAPDGRTYHEYAELSAKRIIALKDKVGLFNEDNLYEPQYAPELFCSKEHMDIARETVRKSVVLLTNKADQRGVSLPIADSETSNVLLVGSLADSPRDMIGAWPGRSYAVSDCYPSRVVTYRRAFCGDERDPDNKFRCDYTPGYTHPLWSDLYDQEGLQPEQQPSAGNWTAAIDKITSGNYTHVLFFVGDLETTNGESTSRTSLTLPGRQLELMQEAHAALAGAKLTNPPKLIAVYLTARASVVEWEVEHLDALVYGWVAGHQGGNGLRDVLVGNKYDVTGRLPFTTPRHEGQIPIYYYQPNATRDIYFHCGGVEEEYTGKKPIYRSQYIDSRSDPRFVFGHGLHYTGFAVGNVDIEPKVIQAGSKEPIIVTGVLQKAADGPANTAEIVQLYIRDVVRSSAPPNKMLRRFQRFEFGDDTEEFEGGIAERLDFMFELDLLEDFGFYTPDLRYIVEPGDFDIFVGLNSADEANKVTLTVV